MSRDDYPRAWNEDMNAYNISDDMKGAKTRPVPNSDRLEVWTVHGRDFLAIHRVCEYRDTDEQEIKARTIDMYIALNRCFRCLRHFRGWASDPKDKNGKNWYAIVDYMPYSLDEKLSELNATQKTTIIFGLALQLCAITSVPSGHFESEPKEEREGCFVHRQLSPDKILLDKDLRPYIGNYVGERWLYFNDDRPSGAPGKLTVDQSKLGGVYGAPEMLDLSTGYDYKVMVWSYGLIVAHIITGKQPFVGSIQKKNLFLCDRRREGPKAVEKALTDSGCYQDQKWKSFFDMCLQRDPNRRSTFEGIVTYLVNESVLVPGADITEVEEFLESESGGEFEPLFRYCFGTTT